MAQAFPIAFVMCVLTVATATACHLDSGSKRACITSKDCLDGYVCSSDSECSVASTTPSSSTLPHSTSPSFANPEIVSLEKDSVGCFLLTWADKSSSETGFEIQRKLEPSDFFLWARAAPDATEMQLCFDRTGLVRLRVCALRDEGLPMCSDTADTTVMVGDVFSPAAVQVPVMPEARSVVKDDGSVTLSWQYAGDDFKDKDTGRCGFRIYACSFGAKACLDAPEFWVVVGGLPADATSYEIPAKSGLNPTGYAIRAHNRYGESAYGVVADVEPRTGL